LNYRRALIGVMIFFFVFWFVVPLVFPLAARPIYLVTLPFRYLGVLVHEMGHGLGTLVTGGKFHWFQLDFLRGGMAVTSGGWRMATLLGGLLGPALFGAILLQLSTRAATPRPVLYGIGVFFLIAVYYIAKPLVFGDGHTKELYQWSPIRLGAILVPGLGLFGLWYLFKMGPGIQRLAIQVLGVVMCYAAYSDTRYIFRYAVLPNGMYSDSRELAGIFWTSAAAAPRWLFWVIALAISVLNFSLMAWGVWRALQAGEGPLPHPSGGERIQ